MQQTDGNRIESERRRGRGAISNESGRFDLVRTEESDGWDIPIARSDFRTELRFETAKSIITRNQSPDVPFDRSINPYRGCEHGCVYCFARPTHSFLGYSAGLDFETRLIARPNAPELLEKTLRRKGYSVATLAVGTNTDPYQPVEKEQHIWRQCLQVLSDFNHPVAIVTKGVLIERDIDLLSSMAARNLIHVGISITTLDPHLSRLIEPRVPVPARRLTTIQRLADAGVPVRLMMAPVVPALTDSEIEVLVGAAAAAGASALSWIMLRLPLDVAVLFREWLEVHFPDRAARVLARIREMHDGQDYSPVWGHRMQGKGHYADMIALRFKRVMREHGLKEVLPPLAKDLFEAPLAKGDQLSLF